MRKFIAVFLALVLFSFCNYAGDGNAVVNENMSLSKYSLSSFNYKSFNSLDTEYDLALMNLQVDVMGFLMFGPQISLDFQFANMVAVGPFFRWNYAGVIYQGVITDWFYEETVVSPASYGIGVQAKVLIPVGSGMHRPYAGISYERFHGEESYDPGGTDGKHIWEYKANVILVNLGYRMITQSSFNLSIGLSLGISTETENIDYYEFGDGTVDHNLLYNRFIGMLQIGLGWQLGK
ncbi:MAG: hypothetical protein PF485_06515 [Bacteroidales bacterium]|jgi:hypothetical protein|nr:hypothetical protein [Bacteroidales bacterium]